MSTAWLIGTSIELNKLLPKVSRVAGTMVVRSSSVRVITHSNLSQVPPLRMHMGKWPAARTTKVASAGRPYGEMGIF